MTEHSGRFEREYYCHGCHLIYWGYFDPMLEGREPCPHCMTGSSENVCACDTIGHAYCSLNHEEFSQKYGRSMDGETLWWREEWVPAAEVGFYAGRTAWGHRHEPATEALEFWHDRYARSLRAKFAWMRRKSEIAGVEE